MKRLFALIALLPMSAYAADNAVVMTAGTGITFRSVDVGSGVQSPMHILGNSSGTAIYGTAGTANAAVLSVQGIASGTALSISGASGAFATGSMVDLLTMRGTVAAGTAAANSILAGGVYNSTPITLTNTQGAALQSDANGYLKVSVTNATTAIANNADAVAATSGGNSPTVGYGYVYNGSTWDRMPGTTNGVKVQTVAGATGGGTISSAIAPATPAGVNLKASAGTVLKVFATTIQSTPIYIKFYNSASAPTCGSGTPVGRFMVPVASTAANGGGTNIDLGDIGAAFGTGIGYCVTGALADNDTTAVTANNTLVNIVWN